MHLLRTPRGYDLRMHLRHDLLGFSWGSVVVFRWTMATTSDAWMNAFEVMSSPPSARSRVYVSRPPLREATPPTPRHRATEPLPH